MTTDIKLLFVEDLFRPNDVLSLPRIAGGADRLSGIRFESRASAGDARQAIRRKCSEAARELVLRAWPKLSMWLFACHSAWQPKTRVTNHLRLWKSLEKGGLVLPSGERFLETQMESPDGVRFFGVVEVPMEEMGRAYRVLEAEPASFLVASGSGHRPSVDHDLISSWQQVRHLDVTTWTRLASAVCSNGQILFRPFGFFDDTEVGLDLLLEPAAFDALLK